VWAVRSSVSALSAVKEHSANTRRYNTQRTSYATCVSLKQQIACSTVLLGKPTVSHPISKYETGKFIAVCKTAQHLCIIWIQLIRPSSKVSQFNIYFNIILPSMAKFLKWFPSFMLSWQDIQLVFQKFFKLQIAVCRNEMQNNAVWYLYCSVNSDTAVGLLLAPA